MSQYSIIILDADESRADYFEGMFKKDEHIVNVHSTIGSTIRHTTKSDKVAFLVEYNTLTAENRIDVIKFFKEYSKQNVFLFNVPDNANKRLAFYELGAKRVFDTSHPLKEIYYALMWPIKNMASDTNENQMISSGKLENISLTSLIKNLAGEERTGILKVVTENNSGKIYFKDGYITHSQVGLFVGEKAVLHMLFWYSGEFIFNSTTSFNDAASINVSIVTLLIIAEDLRKSYLQNLKDIGSQKAVVQIKYAGDLASSPIGIVKGFQEIIMRPVVLKMVFENPFYTCYETAEKLAELKSNGFLSVTDEGNVPEEKENGEEVPLGTFSLLSKNEAEEFCHQINLDKLHSGKILMISTLGKSGYHTLQCIVQNGNDIVQRNNAHVCKVEVLTQTDISFYSLRIDDDILETIGKISDDFTAIVFFVDVQQADKFEYTSYIIRGLIKNDDVLWVPFAVNSTTDIDLDDVKEKLGIQKYIPFISCDPKEENDVKMILLSLKKYKQSEPDAKIGQEEKV